MEHKKYLSELLDVDLCQMIGDYNECHYDTGVYPLGSKIRLLTELVCKDFQIVFNLTYGEKAFMEEVMKRFEIDHT